MAFIVQDDTGQVVAATAYIDATFFLEYHTCRGNVAVEDFDIEELIEPAIVLATDYMDSRYFEQYVGDKKIAGAIRQTTQWPRDAAFDRDGYDVSDSIPDVLKEVTAEYALSAISDDGTLVALTEEFDNSRDRGIKRIKEKVDVIETDTEYHDYGQTPVTKEHPKPDMMIELLLKFSSSTNELLRA